MKMQMTLLALVAAGALAGPSVRAQCGPGWHGSQGWGTQGPYGHLFDSHTIVTLSGRVTAVDRFTPQGMGPGIHVILETADETVPIHVGPEWYVAGQDTKLEVGDKIQVRGSRVTFESKPAIIAVEIRKGEQVLRLRAENGFPVWAGWRRAAAPSSQQ